ncbi:NB-ARC domain-containing protein [Streptomyces sp. RB6PN25]|uniref:NB-ARC domain-containing protein n=1 Tax=Streptomyces humicola TaxID=2953240 RepID=A0ABT1PSB0_9ACTN|nr:BTAD domain-containing putative transcriptional regulator [Streptomyces humicola]MCQ4080563.1 NB-ARC domain-containing protein [Streptomyces humicola]
MTDAVYFGLLGPLEIRYAGRTVPLQAGRQRAVLALMLLQPGHEVTAQSFIKYLWDGEPPAGARNTVQAYVARLRRTLRESTGSDTAIRTGSTGYALAAADEAVDLTRFRSLASAAERHLARGQLAAASHQLRDALGLWRGSALQDVLCDLLQRDEAPALEEERLHVVERLCDIDLTRGGPGSPAAALSLLRPVIAERPLHERPWCQLIAALYRCGRRAEALSAYHDVARLLYAELGVEPGPDLRAVHRSVLDDVDVEWPPRRERATVCGAAPVHDAWSEPRQLPGGPPEVAGRDAEADRAVRRLTTPPAAGTVPIVVVTGAPGSGKTALAVRVARSLADRFPDGQLFLPLADPCGAPRSPGALLTDALYATGQTDGAQPPCPAAQSARLRARLAGRRVLLVLDDATDAEQVMPLLPGEPGCAVLVTARTELPALTAFHGAHRLVLDALSPQASLALLGQIIGAERIAAEPHAAAELAALCGHLPLALCVAAANLAGRRFTSVGSYAAELRTGDRLALLSLCGGGAVKGTFDRSYRALPAPAQRLFRLLGSTPLPEVTTKDAAVLAGLAEREAEEHLQRLTAAHLASEHAPGSVRLPGLLRLYAAERARAEEAPSDLNAARARLLRRQLVPLVG